MQAGYRSGCTCHASRRGFLGGAGAALAAAATPSALSAAAAPRRCIDVHSHVVPPSYVEVLKAGGALGAGYAGWSPDKAIEAMERLGIATSILSIPNPTKFPTGIEVNRTLARTVNEYAARLQQDHPQRFGSFAYLPLDDVDGSLRELTYALDVLKADGVFCWTNYGAKWFGDPAFEPVYQELNRRKAVVYTHPRAANCCSALDNIVTGDVIEYQTDTTRAIAELTFSGMATRYPDMQVIFSHGGGVLPFMSRRLAVVAERPQYKAFLPDGFLAAARRLYFDTAQQIEHAPLAAMKEVLTPSRIVFGTDYPAVSQQTADAIDASGVFDAREQQMIWRGNAAKLFPRLA